MQSELTNFFEKISSVIHSKLPFVVYRKPNENLVKLIVQNSTELHSLNSFTEEGFVFAPFNKKENKIIFPAEKSEFQSIELSNLESLDILEKQAEFKIVSDLAKDQKKHLNLTGATINFIQNKKAEKIVISRKEVLQSEEFNILVSFKKMLKAYQNAMVYTWFHPKVGCWMGASPERLIHVKNGIFKTMSLAGTQAYVNSTQVEWKTKELDEQQFVTDYILETIKQTISDISVSKPFTAKAGSLLHIRTDISGKLTSDNSLGELVNALHPTPAVCGVPKQTAINFIAKNENYHRSFYTGYLGELHQNNETNLYVNLRCMEISDAKISLYIGGGITKDSKPEKEWNETVNKAKVMKKIL